jgi:TPR repeat protein
MEAKGAKGEAANPNTLAAFRESAAKGDARSQARLGKIYLYGMGVERDYKLALAWYRKAADQGDGEAQANLGHMIEKGLGVEPDVQRALAWYKKAVAQGNAFGQILLGDLYLNGTGVDQSTRKAIACYQKSAEQDKDREGAALAQLRLGAMYFQGRGVEKDLRKGFELYLQAAKLGNAEAQRCIGAMYRDGVGVERNHKKALEWFQKSARENRAPADSAMGDIFRDGLFVEKNIPEAMKWYEKAAARGDKYAKKELLKLLQKEYARESFKTDPAPVDPGHAQTKAEAAGVERPAAGIEKKEEKVLERKDKAVEKGSDSVPGQPQPASAKPQTTKKIPKIKSPRPVPEKKRETKKALAPRTLRYLFPAMGMIGLALLIMFFSFTRKTGRTPASPVPKTIKIAAPAWPGPRAIPTLMPGLPPGTPAIAFARSSSPRPIAKTPPPVAAPAPAAVMAAPAPPLLRREYKSLDERELSEALSAKKLFDAQRNPGGNFQHQYEARNKGGLSLILDRATNLVWTRQQNLVRMNLSKTQNWIESLNRVQYGGIKGWRLPTVEEAASLLKKNAEGEKNFLDAVFGKDIKEIWTGDRFLESGSWVVDFQDGMVRSAKGKARLMSLMVSSNPD